MKLPWLQVDEETFARAEQLAGLLADVDYDRGITLQLLLWRWGLSLGPDDVPPTGVCTSKLALRLMAAACRWPPDRADELAEVFVATELLEVLPDGLRVRGLDRYHGTWRKNRGLNGAKIQEPPNTRTEPERVPNGSRTEPPRNTQTQTQTQNNNNDAGAVRPSLTLVEQPARPRRPKRTDSIEADPRHQPLVEGLVNAYAALRGVKYPFAPRDAASVKGLLLTGTDPVEIIAAWKRALQHHGFPTVSTLPQLADHLAHFLGAAPPAAAKPATSALPPPSASFRTEGPITTTIRRGF